MAKAFLVRWGTQNDFDAIKLQIREIGFTIDNERLWVGGNDENLHIPNENFVKNMILTEVPKYKPLTGTSVELLTTHSPGALAFNKDGKHLVYKTPTGQNLTLVDTSMMPSNTATSVKVALENIDTADNNSVTINGYDRQIEMVFLNGVLCTIHPDDTRRYEVNRTDKTLKVYGCSENDIISYF